jgi:phosphoglycolate phosphatase-like HAD superfamily hydrolase
MSKDSNQYLTAIDLGGVIEDTWSNKQKWLHNHGFFVKTPMARQELRQLIGKELHQTMLVEVYDEKEMLKSKTFKGVKESLQYLQSLGKIAILTTRSPQKRETVLEWLNIIGIKGLIDELVMIGDEALLPTNTKIPSKLDWCAAHNVKFLID